MIRPFLLALQFLTRIPTPHINNITDKEIGQSQYYYPIIGLIIGFVLISTSSLITLSTGVEAALLLSIWVLITGALHIDGLADCADAWVGGYGDKEKTLSIMKDPQSGPIAVTLVVCVLLIKFAAIESIISSGSWLALLITPIISRAMLPLLFHTTPYARTSGLGSALTQHQSMPFHLFIQLISAGVVFIIFGLKAFFLISAALIVLWAIRRISLKRINGITGDVAGAMVELSEVVVLITFLSL